MSTRRAQYQTRRVLLYIRTTSSGHLSRLRPVSVRAVNKAGFCIRTNRLSWKDIVLSAVPVRVLVKCRPDFRKTSARGRNGGMTSRPRWPSSGTLHVSTSGNAIALIRRSSSLGVCDSSDVPSKSRSLPFAEM